MAQEIVPNYVKKSILSLDLSKTRTPFLVFDESEVLNRVDNIKILASKSFPLFSIYFSYKTINNYHLSKIFKAAGFGGEVASLDEYKCAIMDDISANGIVFDGPLKGRSELEYVINSDICTIIHLDNIAEVKQAISIVRRLISNTNTRFGIRLSHDYNGCESRFGFNSKELKELTQIPDVELLNISGIHIHTGSNINSIECFKKVFNNNKHVINSILVKENSWIDIGGGFPANSKKEQNNYTINLMLKDYSDFLLDEIDLSKVEVILEPGRFLVEDSGYIVSKIHHSKVRNNSLILTCDIGLNYVSSIRSWSHSIECLIDTQNTVNAKLYGSNCFESDLISDSFIYNVNESQYIIIRGCGGYDVPSTNFWLRRPYEIYSLNCSLYIFEHKLSTNYFHGRLMDE